jgi:hydroxyacylglutathione hydrolase
VVDPQLEIEPYLEAAAQKSMRVTHIIETHVQADHVSGARRLAVATGAPVFFHESADVRFPHVRVADGEEHEMGNVRMTFLHTPGHTPDGVSIVVTDRTRGPEPWFVLTGDTLFVGSVGRPDVGGAGAAEEMYESLRRVLLSLDDSIEVYPAHGAGSLCGRAMSSKTGSTIGFERRFNGALRIGDKGAFVASLMADLPAKPPSFETIVGKNRGTIPLQTAKPRPYSAREASEAIGRGACVLDLRDPGTYGAGHVPGALNVWIESPQFGDRVAAFVTPGVPLLVVAEGPSDLERALQALARVGVDDVVGSLQWGMIDWRSEGFPVETVAQITAHDLEDWLDEHRDVVIVDVREPFEWMEGHISGALHVPMLEALRRKDDLPADRPKAVLCAGGLRSSTVISALKRHGISNWYNVTGGMTAWLKAGYPVQK